MHNFIIRRAQESDLPTLGKLGTLLAQTHFDFDSRRFRLGGAASPGGYA